MQVGELGLAQLILALDERGRELNAVMESVRRQDGSESEMNEVRARASLCADLVKVCMDELSEALGTEVTVEKLRESEPSATPGGE